MRLLALGVRFLVDGEQTGGAFSLVEHPLPSRALGAPIHFWNAGDEPARLLELISPAGFEQGRWPWQLLGALSPPGRR